MTYNSTKQVVVSIKPSEIYTKANARGTIKDNLSGFTIIGFRPVVASDWFVNKYTLKPDCGESWWAAADTPRFILRRILQPEFPEWE